MGSEEREGRKEEVTRREGEPMSESSREEARMHRKKRKKEKYEGKVWQAVRETEKK